MTADPEPWVADYEALCLTLTRQSQADAAMIVGNRALTPLVNRTTAETWVWDSVTVGGASLCGWFATGRIGDWTFIWEDNGWRGVTEDVTCALAENGHSASLFWNINLQMRFMEARDGVLARNFEPWLWGADDPWAGPLGTPLAGESELPWEDDPQTSGLSLLSMISGLPQASPAWLDEPGVRFWGHEL